MEIVVEILLICYFAFVLYIVATSINGYKKEEKKKVEKKKEWKEEEM